jgi:hypothetical protein
MSQPRKLEVEWVDAASGGGWKSYDDREKALIRCRSIGYVLHEDKASLTLCQSYSVEARNHADTITIPKGCIKKRRRL